MKNIFYYFFGIITALYAFVVLFNLYAPEFIDDYWLKILYTEYAQEWYYISIAIGVLTVLFAIIWIYNLGRTSNSKEPLLINKKEENE